LRETIVFMLGSSYLFYLMRQEREKNKKLSLLWYDYGNTIINTILFDFDVVGFSRRRKLTENPFPTTDTSPENRIHTRRIVRTRSNAEIT
jgi:hypothetical protein